eukprot:6471121-Prymnesium_polylepis.1
MPCRGATVAAGGGGVQRSPRVGPGRCTRERVVSTAVARPPSPSGGQERRFRCGFERGASGKGGAVPAAACQVTISSAALETHRVVFASRAPPLLLTHLRRGSAARESLVPVTGTTLPLSSAGLRGGGGVHGRVCGARVLHACAGDVLMDDFGGEAGSGAPMPFTPDFTPDASSGPPRCFTLIASH